MYVPEAGQAEMIEGTPAAQAAKLMQIIRDGRGA
jgi:electron transfer flavoprotein beta subunit